MKKIDLGRRMKEIRKNHKYSLKDLSELCQCSVNYLSQLERGLNSPTIVTLIRITEALGVQLVDFFSEKSLNNSPKVIRKKNRKSFSRELSGVTYEMLSSSDDGSLFDAFLVTLRPRATIGTTSHERKGNEFLYVVSGMLDLNIGGLGYKLFPGDSICFNSGEPHELRNNSKSASVEVISISAPPR